MRVFAARPISVAALACLLGACAAPQDRSAEAAKQAREAVPAAPATWQALQAELGEVPVGWVAQLSDPTLSRLVSEAQQNNRNLQAAAANVERSRALARQAGALLSPQVGLSINSSNSGDFEGRSSDSVNFGLEASWEADLWGRLRSGSQAALESVQVAQADYTYSQHSLAAGVARGYFVSVDATRQHGLAKNIVDALTETQRIAQLQFDNGAATRQDLALVNSDLARANDTLAAAEGARRDAVRALELLLGRYPGAELEVGAALPPVPPPPPAGLPAELLERRPDLVSAERQIAAALNKVDQAKAAKLPQLSLSGSVGGASSALSDLLDPANLAWQAVGALVAPLFDGGQRDAQVQLASADVRAATAQYAQVALTAFSEVESALDQGVVLRQRHTALISALSEARRALDIAELRYQEGETDLLDVLTIQQRVFGVEADNLSIERALLDQYVALNLGLGGDWR